MHYPRCKALVTDIDGTITNAKIQLVPRALVAIRQLGDQGIPVILASGNRAATMLALTSYLGASEVFIGENGAVIGVGRTILSVEGDRDAIEATMRFLRERYPGKVVPREGLTPRYVEHTIERLLDVNEVNRVLKEAGFRINLVDTGYALHITDPTVNKGVGLQKVASYLGLKPVDFAAIGDGDNDVSLLKIAGVKLAVNNATAAVKRIADWVSPSGYGEGFSQAVDFLLKNDVFSKGLNQGDQKRS